ncbi:MAG: hypothetical protein JJU29_10870 [Verrucomicrobia bacterium]|nr:hypothetical protein [Verrucomicrobiota bacterium]MCH8512507.1 hypothetical protein [Kiritimatiellia bacterium]
MKSRLRIFFCFTLILLSLGLMVWMHRILSEATHLATMGAAAGPLAEIAPNLHRFLLWISLDLEAPMPPELEPISFLDEVFFQVQHLFSLGLSGMILGLGGLLWGGTARTWPGKFRRGISTALLVLGLWGMLVVGWAWTSHERMVPRRDRREKTDLLFHQYYFVNHRLKDVALPLSPHGRQIPPRPHEDEDVHLILTSTGNIRIGNTPLSTRDLTEILQQGLTNAPDLRVFLWMDIQASPQDQERLFTAMETAGVSEDQTFRVVILTDAEGQSSIEIRALPAKFDPTLPD